ncbi:MAG: transporter substrate-binding domain-containing protein [Azonexus sp.]
MNLRLPTLRAHLVVAARSLVAAAALICSLAHALELSVAIVVYDPAQVSAQGTRVPVSAPGADLMGVADELMREVCRRINARCHIAYVPFAEILPGIESGRFDLGFGEVLRTPDREKRFAFSDLIWRSSSRLVGAPATAREFAARLGQPVRIDTLRDARVAAVAGSQQQDYLERVAERRKLTALAAATPAETIDALRDNRADFALLPIRAGYSLISSEHSVGFEFVGPAVADHGLGDTTHIVLRKQDRKLRLAVNRAIAEIRADGTFQRIMQRHFPVSLD